MSGEYPDSLLPFLLIFIIYASVFVFSLCRIIEPLTSRCSKFRFKPLANEILTSRLQTILDKEGVKCGPGVIDGVVSASEGDLRKAITFLQSAARLRGDEEIVVGDILEIAGVSVTL